MYVVCYSNDDGDTWVEETNPNVQVQVAGMHAVYPTTFNKDSVNLTSRPCVLSADLDSSREPRVAYPYKSANHFADTSLA